ncbi:MAG: hypothetical protein AAF990_03530 [Bacteroidota bacterium]
MKKIAIIAFILLSYTGVSLGTIGKAMLTPYHVMMGALIAIFIFYRKKEYIHIFVSLLVLLFYVCLVNFLNYPDFKFTSLIYTLTFGIELIVLYNLIRDCAPDRIRKAFQFILLSYGINIVAGFVVLSAGLGHSFLQNIFGIAHPESGGSRPMGFSSEPSYASFIISIAHLCYSHLNGHRFDLPSLRISGLYVVSSLLLGSAYGLLFLLINILDWTQVYYKKMRVRSKRMFSIICVGLALVGGNLVSKVEDGPVERITNLVEIFQKNRAVGPREMLDKLKTKDPSAFARIGPTYLLFNSDRLDDFNIVLGAGAGTAGIIIPQFLQGSLIDEDDDVLDVGVVPAFIFDYGLIGFALFILFLINCFTKLPFPFWLSMILILPNANINTQLFWYGIASLLIISIIKTSAIRDAAMQNRLQNTLR